MTRQTTLTKNRKPIRRKALDFKPFSAGESSSARTNGSCRLFSCIFDIAHTLYLAGLLLEDLGRFRRVVQVAWQIGQKPQAVEVMIVNTIARPGIDDLPLW
jgi:hypothetical protein